MTEMTPLTGEPLAIDLVNTRTAEADLLTTPAALGDWLSLEADRLPQYARVEPDGKALAAVRGVRDHTLAALEALLHGRRPPATSLQGLASVLNAAPSRVRVEWDGASVAVQAVRGGTAAERLAAELAQAAVELLADPSIAKLRQCEAEDCVLLFVPAHPRRRWCSAERCGNRVRVARYYQRRKADPVEG